MEIFRHGNETQFSAKKWVGITDLEKHFFSENIVETFSLLVLLNFSPITM